MAAPTMAAPATPASVLTRAPEPARKITPKDGNMSRLDELNKILHKLQSDSHGLEASALISEDGLMIASALTPNLDESRVAGVTATLLNLGTRAAVELVRGEVKEVIIRGEKGYAVMIDVGRGALLLAVADETAKLGLTFFDMHEAIRALQKVL
jgi:predicted regulator of Ras-like GTPase activity (Roadblock/LC7/MglB family)